MRFSPFVLPAGWGQTLAPKNLCLWDSLREQKSHFDYLFGLVC